MRSRAADRHALAFCQHAHPPTHAPTHLEQVVHGVWRQAQPQAECLQQLEADAGHLGKVGAQHRPELLLQ